MDANVKWCHHLKFTGSADSGISIPLSGSSEAGSPSDGFRPLELILIGLGGCTGMDVISILEKKQQAVTAFEIKLHAERAQDHPKIFTGITLEYVITGTKIDPQAVKRAIELSETKYCSAMAMLVKNSPIQTKFTIINTD